MAQAEAESARLFDVVREGTYPADWPMVAWLVKLIAGGHCEHCGRRRQLAVHHLDRDKLNLQHWNLVAHCWDSCYLWVETHLSPDRDPYLFGDEQPAWLAWRFQDRARWPPRDRPVLATIADRAGGGERGGGPRCTGRACACGCGTRVGIGSRDGRPRLYCGGACRQRVYRERRLRQLSLFASPPS